ncbi:uncharacterized protein STAUR_7361 [Stigmatella aurantiaca DW4/3-1]|uniref:Uncharacterized protein n=1 Tax=Stigmatella aurantiaca (strain DW4/3-1) TaxID=378806 RepID=E3FEG1_STIAD|nr:uncharacterized protein STAUR_7361 [Stigmatella aurantiaca DW4/3-1]
MGAGAAHLHHPRRLPHRRLQGGPVAQVTPGERATGPQPVNGALEDHLAAGGAGTGAEVDDVVGDRDHLWLVLDHKDGVALVTQPQQQAVHPLNVVRVQPDRRLIEHVGHVGERRSKVPDHLGALCLAARQRPRRPVEAEIAQPDLHERVERLLQRRQQRRDGRLFQTAHPLGQIADLHRTGVGDVNPLDLGGPGSLAEPGAAALRTGGERHRPLHERTDVGLHRVDVLGQERLLELGDQALVGHVDVLDLDLGGLPIEEVVALLLGVFADWLVRVEETRGREDAHLPAVGGVARDGERALGERLRVVVQLGQVDVGHRAHALASRAHAAGDREHAFLGLPGAFLDRDLPDRADRRDVEGEGVGRADVGLAKAAEDHPQQRIRIGGGAHRRAGVGAHPLLVDDDRGRQPFEDVDLGPAQRRHEPLHERAVRLVDQPLRLRRDGAEHQRRFARSRDAGEHG